jgi:hypothetical protein
MFDTVTQPEQHYSVTVRAMSSTYRLDVQRSVILAEHRTLDHERQLTGGTIRWRTRLFPSGCSNSSRDMVPERGCVGTVSTRYRRRHWTRDLQLFRTAVSAYSCSYGRALSSPSQARFHTEQILRNSRIYGSSPSGGLRLGPDTGFPLTCP